MLMEKIGIVTDEAADLPKEIIEKYHIAVTPVKLFWPEVENLPGDNTFQKMRELEKQGIQSFGKTSQSSMKDFLDKYNLQFSNFQKILCLTVTSKLSGTNNSAVQAVKFLDKDKQDKVFVIDTLNVSGGQALLILKAIELIERGEEAEDIVSKIKEMIPRVHFYIMFNDPKWIEASGRVSHLVAGLMRGMAKAGIRPVLVIKDGVIVPAGLKSGVKDMSTGLFKQFEKDIKNMGIGGKKIKAVITHGDDLAEAGRLKKMIEEKFGSTEIIFINMVNDVVGAIAGPDALTLAWCED